MQKLKRADLNQTYLFTLCVCVGGGDGGGGGRAVQRHYQLEQLGNEHTKLTR